MSSSLFRDLLARVTELTLPLQHDDGSLPGDLHAWYMVALPWTHSYLDAESPFHADPRLLEAILRYGDFLARAYAGEGAFRLPGGRSDGFHVTWNFSRLRMAELLAAELGAERRARWSEQLIDSGIHVMEIVPDLERFDGAVPNSVIWAYAYLHAVGVLYDVRAYREAAELALSRILDSQTPDGCFRENGSACGIQGTPVTHYNTVSADALAVYHARSGDPRAAAALEKAWRWYFDFLLPDGTPPPTLDSRQTHRHQAPFDNAYWMNLPEGRALALRQWAPVLERWREAVKPGSVWGIGLMALQYAYYHEEVVPRPPTWPEYARMIAEEACVRRRNGWVAVLSGMTNIVNSNMGLRLFCLERQDCLSLAHERLGLLIGSSHSLVDERFSTFVFYENGAAHYLHNHAYLRSTPPLDTLLLRYGGNVGALSVDTTRPERAEVTFSLHGELGERAQRGLGHPLTAMAARAHLALRLHDGQAVTHQGNTRTLGDDALALEVAPGEVVDFGAWALTSPDAAWELRWPCYTRDPYAALGKGEKLAVAETLLHPGAPFGPAGPIATFQVLISPAS